MNNKIKTEDIIKSLRMCHDPTVTRCDGCITKPSAGCYQRITSIAADRLEELNDHSLDSTKMAQDNADCAIMQRAIDTCGRQAQTDVAIEEMAELTKALLKTRRVPDDDYATQEHACSNVIEEIADVSIMIDQLKIMYGEPRVDAVRKQKLVRLESRLNDAEKES